MSIVTTRDGRTITLLSLDDLREPVDSGGQIRAYCHLHGSDHQRSLSISRMSGWGYCHACGSRVLLTEYNPDAASSLFHANMPYYPQASRSARPATGSPGVPSSPRFSSQDHLEMITHSQEIPAWQRRERDLLLSLTPRFREALCHKRAQQYLVARGIPLSFAQDMGIGYVPPALLGERHLRLEAKLLSRWVDRILFPLTSEEGDGYIGRTLYEWQYGMSEEQHKQVLSQLKAPKRWIKTNPAGWCGPAPTELSARIIVVEGGFDRLSLIAGGFSLKDVVALAGTTIQATQWREHVKAVVLALDADTGGQEATTRLSNHLVATGIAVVHCVPPSDQWGKDWNERWVRIGPQGIWPLYDAFWHLCKVFSPVSC